MLVLDPPANQKVQILKLIKELEDEPKFEGSQNQTNTTERYNHRYFFAKHAFLVLILLITKDN